MIYCEALPRHRYISVSPHKELGSIPELALFKAGYLSVSKSNKDSFALIIEGTGVSFKIDCGKIEHARTEAARYANHNSVIICKSIFGTRVYEAVESISNTSSDFMVTHNGHLITKDKDIYDPVDVKDISEKLAGQIRNINREKIMPMIEDWAKTLDVDWAHMTKEQIQGVFEAGRKLIQGFSTKDLLPQFIAPIVEVTRNVGSQTKAAIKDRYLGRISTTFTGREQKALEQVSGQAGWFIRDSQKNISNSMTDKGRKIIEDGLKDGFGRKDIADMLRKEMPSMYETKSGQYASVIAANAVARARSYSEMSTYNSIGVDSLEVVAMLDERTTDICRFMDGQIINVGSCMAIADECANAKNPEDIYDLSPFMKNAKDDKGQLQIVTMKGVYIADIQRSGIGNVDDRGQFSAKVSGNDLPGKARVGAPPYHHHCRTTTVPKLEMIQVPAGATGRGATPGISVDRSKTPIVIDRKTKGETVSGKPGPIDTIAIPSSRLMIEFDRAMDKLNTEGNSLIDGIDPVPAMLFTRKQGNDRHLEYNGSYNNFSSKAQPVLFDNKDGVEKIAFLSFRNPKTEAAASNSIINSCILAKNASTNSQIIMRVSKDDNPADWLRFNAKDDKDNFIRTSYLEALSKNELPAKINGIFDEAVKRGIIKRTDETEIYGKRYGIQDRKKELTAFLKIQLPGDTKRKPKLPKVTRLNLEPKPQTKSHIGAPKNEPLLTQRVRFVSTQEQKEINPTGRSLANANIQHMVMQHRPEYDAMSVSIANRSYLIRQQSVHPETGAILSNTGWDHQPVGNMADFKPFATIENHNNMVSVFSPYPLSQPSPNHKVRGEVAPRAMDVHARILLAERKTPGNAIRDYHVFDANGNSFHLRVDRQVLREMSDAEFAYCLRMPNPGGGGLGQNDYFKEASERGMVATNDIRKMYKKITVDNSDDRLLIGIPVKEQTAIRIKQAKAEVEDRVAKKLEEIPIDFRGSREKEAKIRIVKDLIVDNKHTADTRKALELPIGKGNQKVFNDLTIESLKNTGDRMLQAIKLQGLPSFEFTGKQRSFYERLGHTAGQTTGRSSISISKNLKVPALNLKKTQLAATIAHELGHHLETIGAIGQSAFYARNEAITGKSLIKLFQKGDDIGFVGNFPSAYQGKIYQERFNSSSTEQAKARLEAEYEGGAYSNSMATEFTAENQRLLFDTDWIGANTSDRSTPELERTRKDFSITTDSMDSVYHYLSVMRGNYVL